MIPKKCKKCKYWIFSTTLGSLKVPEWHCRFGFSSFDEDCMSEAEYNINCINRFYREHPEYLQLKFNF